MKKFLAFTSILSLAATLSAMQVLWDVDSLTDGSSNDLDLDFDNIVFISQNDIISYDSAAGVYTINDGTAITGTQTDDDPITGYTELDAGTTYALAIYSPDDGKYYALTGSSPEGTLTITPAAPANPLDPAQTGWNNPSGSVSYTGTTVASRVPGVSVPEPATAVMAFAGLALLIRRRKQA